MFVNELFTVVQQDKSSNYAHKKQLIVLFDHWPKNR